jgi:phosphatidylethanolamine/phosphatidyl-N-methylethanolamine N-methyltransferase
MKNENKVFFKAFIENPLRTGSIVQSSPFLTERMLKNIDFTNHRCIVEFGGGSGTFTKQILKKISRDTVLLCFEIDPGLAKQISANIQDKRLKVICDSAENIDIYLKKYGFEKADCIISGLPLASLPKETSRTILSQAYEYLHSGGQYIQFQYSLTSLRHLKYIFSTVSVTFVFLNFPPAFVYSCTKI